MKQRLLLELRPPQADSQVRIFWLPHAGGTANSFRELSQGLPSWIHPFGFEYPGRGSRFLDDPAGVSDLGSEVAQVCSSQGAAFAIAGHSFGAMVGYEACLQLAAARRALPCLLILSAMPPPHREWTSPLDHRLPDQELLGELSRLGESMAAFHDPEFRELGLAAIRSDLKALNDHPRKTNGSPIAVRMAAYGGDSDGLVPREAIQSWRTATTGAFSTRTFPGSHFYFRNDERAFIDAVSRDLWAALHGTPEIGGPSSAESAPKI